MAKKYCKKSSMQAVANEVKTRKGSSSSIQGSNLATDINNLVIPAQRGSPTTVLTPSSTSKTIQRGKYIGGSVSVVLQDATAQLSQNGGYVPIDSGKTLASVKVPASPVKQCVAGTISPSSSSGSITISGLSFRPSGICIALTASGTGLVENPIISYVAYNNGSVYGNVPSSSYGGAMVTSMTTNITDTSITISNVNAVAESTTYTGKFRRGQHTYFVWG